jgi:thiol-disulfide isomerase/thioredoxin
MLRAFCAAAVLAASTVAWGAADSPLRAWTRGATPPLAGESLEGARFDLRELQGKVVVVNFWATWCDPCREEMPSFERLRDRLKGKPFDVVTVNYGEGPERIRAFLQRHKVMLPVVLDRDKDTAKAWGAGGLPMTFIVDARGRVRYSAFGECDWSEGEPLRVVQGLLSEASQAR